MSKEALRIRQLLALNGYWLATNLHWTALLAIMVPSQVAAMAPLNQAQALSGILVMGAWVATLVPPLVGTLSDRCLSRWGRRRPYMAVGLLLNLLGLFFMWQASSLGRLPLYAAAYLLVQFGNNIASASYNALIPDLVGAKQQGEASGYMALMSQLGNILGALACGLLMSQHAVAACFAFIVVILLVFAGWTFVGIEEEPLRQPPDAIDWRILLQSFWLDPRQYPDFAWVFLTRALVTAGMYSVQPFLQYYLRDVCHASHPEATAGNMLAVILVGASISGFYGGKVSDRIGRKPVVYMANGVLAVACLGFLGSRSLPTSFLLGAIYGLGYGAYLSVDWALACAVLPRTMHDGEPRPKNAARDMAIWHIAMVLPQTLAPLIAGRALTIFGGSGMDHYAFPGYAAMFVLAAVFMTVGALLLRNVRGVR